MPVVSHVALLLALAAIVTACGSDSEDSADTKTVTVTRTEIVTVPAEEPEPAEGSTPEAREEFCASEKGDALEQAGSEHTEAFNDADPAAAVRIEKKARRAAENAPAGAECAVLALDAIRFNYNNGANNFGAIDYKARSRSVRRFQKEHDLLKVLPSF